MFRTVLGCIARRPLTLLVAGQAVNKQTSVYVVYPLVSDFSFRFIRYGPEATAASGSPQPLPSLVSLFSKFRELEDFASETNARKSIWVQLTVTSSL